MPWRAKIETNLEQIITNQICLDLYQICLDFSERSEESLAQVVHGRQETQKNVEIVAAGRLCEEYSLYLHLKIIMQEKSYN